MSGKLREYFNKQPRLGVISTSSKDGTVDCAVYGSPQMIDKKTVLVALARGRTFANLEENPYAVFMIMEQAAGVLDWKGIRVYLKMLEYATSGPKLETYKSLDKDEARIIKGHINELRIDPYTPRPQCDIIKERGKRPPIYRLRAGKHRAEYFIEGDTFFISKIFPRSGDSDYR